MAKLPLIDGWEIGWSRDVLIACLERGNTETNADYNVAFAIDANDAANCLEGDIDLIVRSWKGTEADLEFVCNFVRRFRS